MKTMQTIQSKSTVPSPPVEAAKTEVASSNPSHQIGATIQKKGELAAGMAKARAKQDQKKKQEHTRNARPSTRNKHQSGQAAKVRNANQKNFYRVKKT